MAAGQQKKRLSATSITRFNVHEQRKRKRKKRSESSVNTWCMRPDISLEWDDGQKRAVAKKEQVAMSWMDLSPLWHPLPQSHSGLADVFLVPKEIFELDNMSGVLSYEVWENHLSESERNFLSQFLPKQSDPNEVVLSLLTEENLNFGNPFNRWCSSLCSGNLHPDAILSRDHQLKTKRKFYYSDLKNYHFGIIEKLQKWKKRWSRCENPEKELFGSLSRKGAMYPVQGDSQMAFDKAKSITVSKRDQPKKVNIDSTKYMSYFKVSRRQYQLVKSIKYSNDGIPSKSLDHVLGDIKGSNLQSYETFEVEERKRLHEHWVQLACKDLPAFFQYHEEQKELRKLQRLSIVQELAAKEEMNTDEVEKNMEANVSPEQEDEESPNNFQDTSPEMSVDVDTQSQSDCDGQDSVAQGSGGHRRSVQSLGGSFSEPNVDNSNKTGEEEILKLPVNSVLSCKETSLKCSPTHQSSFERQNSSQDTTGDATNVSTANNRLEWSPLNRHQDFSPTGTNQEEGQGDPSAADDSIVVPHSLEGSIREPKVLEPRASTPASNVWAEVRTHESYHEPVSRCHMSTSIGDLSLGQPCPAGENAAQIVNMKTDTLDLKAAESVSSAMNLVNDTSFFGSYANQSRDILLPPFPKHQELPPPYAHQLNNVKNLDLSFPIGDNGTQSSRYFSHFQEQRDLLQQRQIRERELYIHPTTNRTLYSNGPYLNQGNLSAETHDWVSLPSPLDGGSLSHNMFREPQDRSTIYGVEPCCGTINHSLGNGGNADGSLFSVLSEYKKLPSTFSCNISSSMPLAPSGELVGVRAGDMFGFSANQLSGSARNREIPASFRVDETSWMNLPRQNPTVHDPASQPYLRTWNR